MKKIGGRKQLGGSGMMKRGEVGLWEEQKRKKMKKDQLFASPHFDPILMMKATGEGGQELDPLFDNI